jgi:hypothetical protein
MSEKRARAAIAVGALLVGAGLAALGAWGGVAGGILLLLGWVEMVFAVHAFGRAGARG